MLIKPFFKIGLIVVFVLIYNSTILAQKVLDTVVVLPPQLSTVFFGSNQQDITDYEFVREGFLIASYSNISNSSFCFY